MSGLGAVSDLTGSAFAVGVSFSITENAAIQLQTSSGSGDLTESGVTLEMDAKQTAFGVWLHTPVSPTSDIVGGLFLTQGKVDLTASNSVSSNSVSVDSDSKVIVIGIRSMLNHQFEGRASLARHDPEDGDSSTSKEIGVTYHPGNDLSVTLKLGLNDDEDITVLGISKYY